MLDLVGYRLVEQHPDDLSYFLAVFSNSLIYLALAALIPKLQKCLTSRETAAQVAWLPIDIAPVMAASIVAHFL